MFWLFNESASVGCSTTKKIYNKKNELEKPHRYELNKNEIQLKFFFILPIEIWFV